MIKIYVIGASSIAEAKKVFKLNNDDIELIPVNSKEDIPINDRFTSAIAELHKFHAPETLPTNYFERNDKKGHERPYKYHK